VLHDKIIEYRDSSMNDHCSRSGCRGSWLL